MNVTLSIDTSARQELLEVRDFIDGLLGNIAEIPLTESGQQEALASRDAVVGVDMNALWPKLGANAQRLLWFAAQSFAPEDCKSLMGRRSAATAKTVSMPTIQMAHALRSWSSLPCRNHAAIPTPRAIRSPDKFRTTPAQRAVTSPHRNWRTCACAINSNVIFETREITAHIDRGDCRIGSGSISSSSLRSAGR